MRCSTVRLRGFTVGFRIFSEDKSGLPWRLWQFMASAKRGEARIECHPQHQSRMVISFLIGKRKCSEQIPVMEFDWLALLNFFTRGQEVPELFFVKERHGFRAITRESAAAVAVEARKERRSLSYAIA